MGKVIRIEDPKELPTIVDFVHDCWFDRDSILLDPLTSVLSIKFVRKATERGSIVGKVLFFKKVRVPTVECFIRIRHAKDCVIKDNEQVGRYDFNEILYRKDAKCIRITTGVPIEIEVNIDKFDVSVEETDTIVEEKTSISLF